MAIQASIDSSSASSRVNHYEQGRQAPDFQIAGQLAECLGVSVTYFYADDNSLAVMILLFDRLTVKSQEKILKDMPRLEK